MFAKRRLTRFEKGRGLVLGGTLLAMENLSGYLYPPVAIIALDLIHLGLVMLWLILRLAESIGLEEGASVLDVGCGNGISAKALHDQFGCRVLGVDLSQQMIAAGRELCDVSHIRLIQGDGEKLSSLVGSNALITCCTMPRFSFHDIHV